MEPNKPNTSSTVNTPDLHQSTKETIKSTTWKGRSVDTFMKIKNKIVGFFLGDFTNRESSSITDNLKVKADIPTENSKIEISIKNVKLAIKGLQKKGFSNKEAKDIIRNISSQEVSEPDIMDKIRDIPEKKYYSKYHSQKEISFHIKLAENHLKELGYDEKTRANTIFTQLDVCNSFAEFYSVLNDIPTLKEYDQGYDSATMVENDKHSYIETLKRYGYDTEIAKHMIEQMHTEETDKNNILNKILQTPTVRMQDQGYSTQKEYIEINDEYSKKLGVKIGDAKKAYNIVEEEQIQASSKEQFINKMEKIIKS